MAIKARAEITLSSIRDIQSVTRYYLLQSSTSTAPAKPTKNPPGGNWVTTEPTYTSGSTNSLYFTDCTVFSDGTFVYSDVSRSSSYEAAKVAYNKAAGAEDVAAAAQKTANGKNTVYYQTEAPSDGTYKTNDIWFDTNNGNKMYMWNGSAWTAEQFGNAAISDLSITNAKIANGTIENAKIANLDAGKITTGTMSAARIKGDELKLGGNNNTDGVMKVYNANGELVGSFTKEGLMAIAGTIAGWTIEQDSLSGEQDFGEEKWHVALSPAFGLRFRDIPDGADPDSGWIREVYYNSGLARFSHVSNGNYYTGAIEACNESDGIQVVPELVVSDVDFPDSDDPVTPDRRRFRMEQHKSGRLSAPYRLRIGLVGGLYHS